jgi:hypothetical protein
MRCKNVIGCAAYGICILLILVGTQNTHKNNGKEYKRKEKNVQKIAKNI